MSLERGTVEGQTPGRRPDRLAAVRLLVLVFAISSWVLAGSASADDSTFHRTTPRAAFDGTGAALVIGVPGGRAWGIESDLRPLPAPGTSVYVRLAVTDGAVREAFVRVAYYASADKRTRQLATSDSAPVAMGRPVLVGIPFDPPPGAVAYRVRVLARLVEPAARSADDAITARLRGVASRTFGSLFSRLLP